LFIILIVKWFGCWKYLFLGVKVKKNMREIIFISLVMDMVSGESEVISPDFFVISLWRGVSSLERPVIFSGEAKVKNRFRVVKN
jgi:hypothetical protein